LPDKFLTGLIITRTFGPLHPVYFNLFNAPHLSALSSTNQLTWDEAPQRGAGLTGQFNLFDRIVDRFMGS